jgi:hypothetical protein
VLRKKKSAIALLDASSEDPNKCLGTVVSLHDDMTDALMSEIKLQAMQNSPRTRIVKLNHPLPLGRPVDPRYDLAVIDSDWRFLVAFAIAADFAALEKVCVAFRYWLRSLVVELVAERLQEQVWIACKHMHVG